MPTARDHTRRDIPGDRRWDETPMELFSQAKSGSPADRQRAIARIVHRHDALVKSLANRFRGYGLPMQDLISEGTIGLMRAIEKFDPSRGVRFSSYATYWVNQHIRRALDTQGPTIRIPCGTIDRIRLLRSTRDDMTQELGREPTDRELARRMGLKPGTVRRLRFGDVSAIPMSAPLDSDQEASPLEQLPDHSSAPDDTVMQRDSERCLTDSLSALDEREKHILELYYGLGDTTPMTFAGIGELIGLSSERVRQLQKASLDRLRTFLRPHREDLLAHIA